MFTRQQVQQMNEKDLRQIVLIPLLRTMGYQDVHEYHGVREYGKDIVGWKNNELGYRKNLTLVVKAKPVSGKSKIDKATAGEIQTQINQCFGKPYLDPINSSSQSVHQCWVVSNYPIGENAIDAIIAGMGNSIHKENIDFIDIDKLWWLIERYMPVQASLQKLEEVQQDFNTWDSHYRLEAYIGNSGIQHTIAEKFPGASQEKPIKIKSVFSFPDTLEGRELREAVERFFEAGTPVKIPGDYIKSLEYSDFLQHVYPSSITTDGFLQLGSVPNPKPLFLRCEISCDDGDQFVLDFHLSCTQVGMKEATLTNQSQLIPIRIQLILRSDVTVSSFHMTLDSGISFNVHQLLMQMQFLRVLSKPHTVRFTNLETGIPIGSSRSEVGQCDPPNSDAIEALEALDALQIKSGQLVFLPEHDLTDEEQQDIKILRLLFRTGKLGAWSKYSPSVTVTDDNREEIRQMLMPFAGGNVSTITFWQEEKFLLFGEEYPLGAIKPVVLPAKLANESVARTFIDQGSCGELLLEFVPSNDGKFTKEYVNWVPDIKEHNTGANEIHISADESQK